MDWFAVVEKAQGLNDNELAMLLCLMSNQHCILCTSPDALHPLEEEAQLISSNVFGLSHTVIRCHESTTLDDFRDGLLIDGRSDEDGSSNRGHGIEIDSAKRHLGRSPVLPSFASSRPLDASGDEGHGQRIANVAIIKGLSLASEDVQIQALELLRTRRIFTHTTVHAAPRMFVMVILQAETDPRLVGHLNDHVFISHYHDKDDGFPNLEEASEWTENDQISLSSVVHRSTTSQTYNSDKQPLLLPEEVRMLADASKRVTVTAEIIAYIYNIIAFLRLHRAVAGGISPKATQMLKLLINCLAPLHGLDFITPALVLLAVRKIYAHRLILAAPENDRSLQYGSDIKAVKRIFEDLRPQDVIEEVLEEVEIPV